MGQRAAESQDPESSSMLKWVEVLLARFPFRLIDLLCALSPGHHGNKAQTSGEAAGP